MLKLIVLNEEELDTDLHNEIVISGSHSCRDLGDFSWAMTSFLYKDIKNVSRSAWKMELTCCSLMGKRTWT